MLAGADAGKPIEMTVFTVADLPGSPLLAPIVDRRRVALLAGDADPEPAGDDAGGAGEIAAERVADNEWQTQHAASLSCP